MAETIWQGTTNVWATAGNWSAGVPANGDTVIFDGSSQMSVAGSDQSAVAPHRIRIHPEYTGDIGSSGSPLKIGPVNFDHRGRGHVYFMNYYASGTYLLVDSGCPRDSAAITLTGYDPLFFNLLRGSVTYAPTSGNSSGSCGMTMSGGTLSSTASARTFNFFVMKGGTVTNVAIVTALVLTGGTFTQTGGTLTRAYVAGGELAITGSITLGGLIGLEGTIDMSKVLSSSTLGTLIIHASCDFLMANERRYALITGNKLRDLRDVYPGGGA